MSRTNQVCICCEERMSCPHFDTRKTVCPGRWSDFSSTIQANNMHKEYFHLTFNTPKEVIAFLNERKNDVNPISITHNSRCADYYVLFYWCYEPD